MLAHVRAHVSWRSIQRVRMFVPMTSAFVVELENDASACVNVLTHTVLMCDCSVCVLLRRAL